MKSYAVDAYDIAGIKNASVIIMSPGGYKDVNS